MKFLRLLYRMFSCPHAKEYEEQDNIPKTLEAAVKELKSFRGIKEFKDAKSTASFHHTTGRWIRNNWKLWEGTNELCRYFKAMGIHHPDDMSGIILDSLHRELNGKPWDVQGQAKHYIEYWEQQGVTFK